MPSDGEEHRGTLGAIARRKSDLAKVLVTNVHVVSTHRNNYTVSGNESIYQGGTAAGDKIGQLYTKTVNGVEKKSCAEGESNDNKLIIYPVDAAALALPTGADIEALTSFNVHFPNDDDNHHVHVENRPIVGPAVDPTPGMRLIAVGAGGGLRTFTVLEPTPADNISLDIQDRETGDPHATVYFDKTKNFTLSQSNEPSQPHDSGSPILWVDEHGNYRIVGIHFGGTDKNEHGHSTSGYASRASAIEEELGITFGIKMPTAVAGDDIIVTSGASVTLDGSGSQSNEVLRDVLQYKWEKQASLTDGTLTQVATTRRYTFQAPSSPETQVYKLTVTDGFGAKHSDTVTVTVVPNTPPVAKPGPNRVVNINYPVTLVGAAEDPDTGHVKGMDYQWSVTSAPSGNDGSSARSTTGTPSSKVKLTTPVENGKRQPHKGAFTPNAIGDYTFTLTITDPGRLSHSDTMKVKAVRDSENLLPTNISALPAANIIDFSWTGVSLATGYEVQVGVAEDGGEIGYASHTTTALSHRVENLAEGTRYYYRVRITNADGVGPWSAVASTVTAIPANHIPIANAGADQTVEAGASVTLDGSGSSDQDGDTLTHLWKQVKGPKVTLSGAAPFFTPLLSWRPLHYPFVGAGFKPALLPLPLFPTPSPLPTPKPRPERSRRI